MSIHPVIDVSERIDNSQMGRFHFVLVFFCSFCLIVDGFDVQALSYAAPALVKEWGIDRALLGPVFGAGLVGMFLGSVVLSVVADKVGRRPVLVLGMLAIGLFTFLTARADTVQELLVLRFLTGLGMGAIIPNAIALAAEYMPARSRITVTMVVAAQFIVGAMLGGLLSAAIIPAFGWRAVFVIGGVLPLLIALAMWMWLPESSRFLIVNGRKADRVLRWLRQIDPSTPAVATLTVAEKPADGQPVLQLFANGRAVPTLLLWGISFLDLLVLYFLANWLPLLMSQAGHSNVSAVLGGTSLQAGGLVGAIVLGLFSQRFGFGRSLLPALVAATVAIACIGQFTSSFPTVIALIFITGIGVVGTQSTLVAMAANYYPTALRSTGIGWTSGIGRLGSIVGPVVGGYLLSLQWSLSELFLAAAGPSLLMTVLMIVLRNRIEHAPVPAVAVAAGQAATSGR